MIHSFMERTIRICNDNISILVDLVLCSLLNYFMFCFIVMTLCLVKFVGCRILLPGSPSFGFYCYARVSICMYSFKLIGIWFLFLVFRVLGSIVRAIMLLVLFVSLMLWPLRFVCCNFFHMLFYAYVEKWIRIVRAMGMTTMFFIVSSSLFYVYIN